MKKLLCLILAALMLTTCALAYGAGTGEAVYTNRWNLASGFVYENAFSYGSTGSRNETFVVENAPGSSVYPIVLACDTIYGGMTITQMIDYAEGLGYNVVGAINADFGYWETRIPCGMVVEDGVYKSSPEGNSAIGFTNGRAYASYKPEVYITFENQTSGGSVTTTHLNKTRSDSGVYLYSEYFSTVSTRTSSSGWYVRFKVLSGEITLDGTVELEVADIITGETSVPIGEGYLILTASDKAGQEAALAKFSKGDRVTLSTECSDSQLALQDWVSGSGNIIAKDGQVFDEDRWDSSITATNPRTAIGIKSDGTVVYLVMDGRTTASKGSTLRELQNHLHDNESVCSADSMRRNLHVVFGGGGNMRMPYQSAVLKTLGAFLHLPTNFIGRKYGTWADRVIHLTMPEDIVLTAQQQIWMKRLYVAYGLSFLYEDLPSCLVPQETALHKKNPLRVLQPTARKAASLHRPQEHREEVCPFCRGQNPNCLHCDGKGVV